MAHRIKHRNLKIRKMITDNPADKDDKKEHRKRLEDIIDMSGTSLVENRTIISSNDNYTLTEGV